MNVDLIKALEAREAESARGPKGEGASDFPDVFESTLSEAAGPPEEPTPEAPARSEMTSERPRGGEESVEPDGSDPAAAEAAAESGAVGGQTAPLDERAPREIEAAGLEAMAEEFEAAQAGGEEGLEEGEALDDEQAEQALAQLDAEGLLGEEEGELAGDEEVAGLTRLATGPGELDEGRPAAEASESDEAAATALADREAGQDQGAPREDAERATPDETHFERAAEGATGASVDPNLRQAAANAEEAQRAPEVTAIDGAPAVANPVAGQVSATTTTATPGTPQPVAASQAIAVQTEWLATRGGGTARMILHPPELGEIAIRVSLRGGSVDVVMVAQEAAAHSVAEEQSERLAQAFANRDLRLENFEVRRGGAEDLTDGGNGRFAESETARDEDARDSRGGGERGSGGAEGSEEAPLAVPRILTRAPETGVDLRI